MLEPKFYEQDCWKVGVELGSGSIRNPAKRLESLPAGSFYSDPELRKMDIRLANMADYCGQGQKLIDIILLAFCYSINGDLSMLLRACGLFSKMIINHDLKIITQNPKAWLNPVQEELLSKIGKRLFH